jgi:hydrogenase 3 maturation protease
MEPDQVRSALQSFSASNAVIVCIGNELKGDDAAGPLLYNKLKDNIGCDIINAGMVPENYIQTIIKKDPANIIVIDAVDFGGAAGEIRLFADNEVPEIALSTHVLSPRMFFDMIKTQCDAEICLIGIQPENTGLNQNLSNMVNRSANELSNIFMEIF